MRRQRIMSAIMFAVLSIGAVTVSAPSSSAVDSSMISYGGSIADYTGRMAHKENKMCSMVVIDEYYALSAKHCFDDEDDTPDNWYARLGHDGFGFASISEIINHPDNDLTLIKFTFPTEHPAAELPARNAVTFGKTGHVIGWGGQDEYYDKSTYSPGRVRGFAPNTDNQAMDVDLHEEYSVIPGDSGGAFLVGDALYGITSATYYDENGEYYPRYRMIPVVDNLDWIEFHTGIEMTDQEEIDPWSFVYNREVMYPSINDDHEYPDAVTENVRHDRSVEINNGEDHHMQTLLPVRGEIRDRFSGDEDDTLGTLVEILAQ